jgi:S1-C subfamily serine protease
MQLLVALALTLAAFPAEPAYDPLGKGFLGISVQTGGMSVSTVSPGTPAERAGFQAGDELLKIGDLVPTSFEEVMAHLKSLRPGTPVPFVVRRAGREVKIKAALMARPATADVPVFPE